MPIPREVDKLVQARFEQLLEACDSLAHQAQEDTAKSSPRGIPSGLTRDKVILSGSGFDELRTNFLSVLQIMSGNSSYLTSVMEKIRALQNTPGGVDALIGTIKGIKSDYENGMFINLAEIIEAEMAADYLGQVEQLLSEGQSGKFDHVPAAVLLGAILEDSLRRLCTRQSPPIADLKSDGSPKTLNPLIDDLKKAGLYNELRAKQLRTFAEIRNHAAHGRFSDFSRSDVEQMIKGISNFLAEFM